MVLVQKILDQLAEAGPWGNLGALFLRYGFKRLNRLPNRDTGLGTGFLQALFPPTTIINSLFLEIGDGAGHFHCDFPNGFSRS
jgi:hypothetical protein